ncbi:MAG: tRNA (adenosine(37)-N6)-threonylcarbamoyltransferase complex transferase subunit TsaD [Candidatus Chaera renei]|uniref:tRNA N6-adenosine threonylcarbamoyltransferase n=1 Tax=Candidatus Chaera renei TaxID=2506947 RepID=A0A4Q0AIY4_9BACT|nr:MAG: tRNA (adenosine(37)-N6)-threonylcarbamoyltransferase complex transferase subunit TsaD [Candidatus Chaera renei]
MTILGIETSCDETAAAVVADGSAPLSSVVRSQIDIHRHFGGVVPEVAARNHLEVILPVIDEALARAKTDWRGIDAIAVTRAPGLIGSLLVGTITARALAITKNKPLYGVHHVEGHVYANFLCHPQPAFPMLALIVSGGHTQLMLFEDHGRFELLGQTMDDAAGEAFDKVAKILGLPYPGGPSIAAAAIQGDAERYRLPIAKLRGSYDFSYSGLKTAVLRAVQAECGKLHDFPSHQLSGLLDDARRHDFAASFQRAAVTSLVEATVRAWRDYSPASVVIAGGVAANSELRRQLKLALPLELTYAPPELCTDNAAMIASLGYYRALYLPPDDPLELTATPSLSLQGAAWRPAK